MIQVTTHEAAEPFDQLTDYLNVHFADADFKYFCTTALATDLFRQYYIFIGENVAHWYDHFRDRYILLAQEAGLTPDESEYVLRSGTFAYNVEQVKMSFPLV